MTDTVGLASMEEDRPALHPSRDPVVDAVRGETPMRMASTKSLLDDPERAWATFRPDRSRPWDLEAVSHLHRRAGFAAPWSVLQRDLKDGLDPSVERLLEGEPT